MLSCLVIGSLLLVDQQIWKPSEHLGKSPRQVVTLGVERWLELRAEKRGNLHFGEEIDEYAWALRLDNHQILKTFSKDRKVWIEKGEKLAHDLASECNSIGPLLFSGTRWRTEVYSNHYHADLAVRRWISQRPPMSELVKSPSTTFERTAKEAKTMSADEFTTSNPKEVAEARKGLIKAHQWLVKHTKTGSKMDAQVTAIFLNSLGIFGE